MKEKIKIGYLNAAAWIRKLKNNVTDINYLELLWRILSHKRLPLFEIVMVMITFSLFWLLHLGAIFQSGESSKDELNEHRMVRLNMALQTYRWANNTFPPDLNTLICEGQDKQTAIPYAVPEILQDAWETPYLYETSGSIFTIKSLGEDKKEGGAGPNEDIILEGP